MKLLVHGIATAICLSFALGAYAGEVNINTASAEELAAELKGIGLNKAKAIVAYRQAHGLFSSPDDLSDVKGIGLRTIDLNRAWIRLDVNEE